MGLRRTLQRHRHTRMGIAEQAQALRDVAEAWSLLARLRVEDAWVAIDRAHDLSQNAGLVHSQAHLVRVAGWAARRRPGALVRELPLVVMAVPAAHVRRAAGLMPGEPGGIGLLGTWRLRRDPPGLEQARSGSPDAWRVSTDGA